MGTALHRYAQQPDGRSNIGVDVGEHVTVLVSPRSADAQAHAESVAALIADQHAEVQRVRAEMAACRSSMEKAKARAAAAEAALDAVLNGKRRFFGRVLMKPATPGVWDADVWLLDPEKQESGIGLRFSSVAEVRLAYPELWVVGTTPDGVLLDVVPRETL